MAVFTIFIFFDIFNQSFLLFHSYNYTYTKLKQQEKKTSKTWYSFISSFDIPCMFHYNYMILGSKGHVFHACMKKHDFVTRKKHEKVARIGHISNVFRIVGAHRAEQSVVS